MEAFLAVAYDVTVGMPWWGWPAVLAMMFWNLLVPEPDDRRLGGSPPDALALAHAATVRALAAERTRIGN